MSSFSLLRWWKKHLRHSVNIWTVSPTVHYTAQTAARKQIKETYIVQIEAGITRYLLFYFEEKLGYQFCFGHASQRCISIVTIELLGNIYTIELFPKYLWNKMRN